MSQEPPNELVPRYWFWSSPDRDRLLGAIKKLRIRLSQAGDAARKEDWWICADCHLSAASAYLGARNYHQGWIALQSAEREALLDPQDPDALQRAAIELLADLDRVSGRRARKIKDQICDPKGELRTDIFTGPLQRRVVDARAVRDEQFETDYFKIMLRRRHLFLLFILLLAGIAGSLILSISGVLPAPFDNTGVMVGVALFGVLGAALSVARGLLSTDLSAKIPAQQIGSFVIWMRPAIGAAAALISFVLLNAKVFSVMDWDPKNPNIIFTVAIIAGFSERFIVGAIERIADGSDRSEGNKSGGDKKTDKQKSNKDRQRPPGQGERQEQETGGRG